MIININRTKNKGAALLAILLVLISVSAYYLVHKLNIRANTVSNQELTRQALMEAKQALMGYAVSYPDIINADESPGFLPCPDMSGNGKSETGCAHSTNTDIGRLPFKTLELSELHDEAGERLWYVLSDNFRNNPKLPVFNSDVPGTLTLDGRGDIVALVIAPGPPLENQNNRGGTPVSVADYLDGANADGDLNFTHIPAQEMNDRVVAITRAELMNFAERRVMSAIDCAVRTYQGFPDCDPTDTSVVPDSYPWLNPVPVSPFTAPEDAAYKSVPGTYAGRMPYHWLDEDPALEPKHATDGRNPFATTLGLQWQIDNDSADINMDSGTTDPSLAPPPHEDCVRTHECDDAELSDVVGSCTWKAASVAPSEYASCQMEIEIDKGLFNRTYNIAFEIPHKYNDNDIELAPPSDTAPRTRTIANICYPPLTTPGDCSPVERIYILVTDEYLLGESYRSIELTNELIDGGMQVANIRYDLDVDSNELPEWVVRNNWHHLILLAYAQEDLPGSDSDITDICDSNDPSRPDCLTVNGTSPPVNDKRGIILSAGRELTATTPGQDRPAADSLDDYFESDNLDPGDETFIRARLADDFNDQIRVLDIP